MEHWNDGEMAMGYWDNGLMVKRLLAEKLINENFLLISIFQYSNIPPFHYSLLKANINGS
jgi:competence CoiA-like predicted nuclease